MIKRLLIFLVLNFLALYIGGLFTGTGVSSEWYQNINKAPWTPPGWVFGAAWTLIMICFAFYMAFLIKSQENFKRVIVLYAVQWILNVGWNPIFFSLKAVIPALIWILLLTVLTFYFFFRYWKALKYRSLLIAPYFIWLIIATSLNAYILFFN